MRTPLIVGATVVSVPREEAPIKRTPAVLLATVSDPSCRHDAVRGHWKAGAPLGGPFMNIPSLAAIFIALTLVPGCAGRDFSRPTPDQLSLGKTTYSEITAKFGEPYRQGEMLKNGQSVKTATYAYASAVTSGVATGVTPARAMGFYFVRDTLVGYEFTSSFAEDSSNFDDAKAYEIKRSVTTEKQVRALLGTPSGVYIYPLTPFEDDRALVYIHVQSKGAGQVARKQLKVILDPLDIVRDVEFEKSGKWD